MERKTDDDKRKSSTILISIWQIQDLYLKWKTNVELHMINVSQALRPKLYDSNTSCVMSTQNDTEKRASVVGVNETQKGHAEM